MSNADEALEKIGKCVFYPNLMLINDLKMFLNNYQFSFITYFDSLFVRIRLASHSMYNRLHERYPETIYVSKNNQCRWIQLAKIVIKRLYLICLHTVHEVVITAIQV